MLDFESLYKTYYMKIYSYVMTIVKDSSSAEEITQKTFFKALNARGSQKYRGNSGEYTWLASIARNLAMDQFRAQRRRGSMPEQEPADPDASSDIRTEEKDTVLQIHLLLHEMKEPYKEVFQLRVFGELSFREIGKVFSRTENWARVTYHRARLKLQEQMEQIDREDEDRNEGK